MVGLMLWVEFGLEGYRGGFVCVLFGDLIGNGGLGCGFALCVFFFAWSNNLDLVSMALDFLLLGLISPPSPPTFKAHLQVHGFCLSLFLLSSFFFLLTDLGFLIVMVVVL